MSGTFQYALYVRNNGKVTAAFENTGVAGSYHDSAASYTAGAPQLVGYTYDGGYVTIYLDGVPDSVHTSAISGTTKTTLTAGIAIGATYIDGALFNRYDGLIDEVQVQPGPRG